jgi:hypothetical protein
MPPDGKFNYFKTFHYLLGETNLIDLSRLFIYKIFNLRIVWIIVKGKAKKDEDDKEFNSWKEVSHWVL